MDKYIQKYIKKGYKLLSKSTYLKEDKELANLIKPRKRFLFWTIPQKALFLKIVNGVFSKETA